ncbi:hypothetical protein PUNSTDRAFT_98590 [Punctularia strigosozonata HHB-11173 SS5]|uniref:uncharacterized protein n=1 Tax=Punctularia strigosozonata (strain HHB-11173) TaxID=741275 RepID=UPI000441847E|nr:uncharacterized protein PUNSTDRAFT_98590 [Punctularia strigosozonata HHB-11173 SS5]EIN11476.1 hypothetical protein PUNSTDRAFT_98590 [Punctularia strigosozonata HHB-11173 SS5]
MAQTYTERWPPRASAVALQFFHPPAATPIVTASSDRCDSQPRSPTRLGLYDLLNHDDHPAPSTWRTTKLASAYSRPLARLSLSSDDAPPLTSDTFSEYSEDPHSRSSHFGAETDPEDDGFDVDIVTASDDDEPFESRHVSYAISDERGRWNEPVPKRVAPAAIPIADIRARFPSSSPESSCTPMTARSERSDYYSSTFGDGEEGEEENSNGRSASPLPPSSPMSVSASGLDDEQDIELEMLPGSDDGKPRELEEEHMPPSSQVEALHEPAQPLKDSSSSAPHSAEDDTAPSSSPADRSPSGHLSQQMHLTDEPCEQQASVLLSAQNVETPEPIADLPLSAGSSQPNLESATQTSSLESPLDLASIPEPSLAPGSEQRSTSPMVPELAHTAEEEVTPESIMALEPSPDTVDVSPDLDLLIVPVCSPESEDVDLDLPSLPLSPLSSPPASRASSPEPLPLCQESLPKPEDVLTESASAIPESDDAVMAVVAAATKKVDAKDELELEEETVMKSKQKSKARRRALADASDARPRKKKRVSVENEEDLGEGTSKRKPKAKPRAKSRDTEAARPRPKTKKETRKRRPTPRSSSSPSPEMVSEDDVASSSSRASSAGPAPSKRARPAACAEYAEYRGMLIEAFATSRASALSAAVLYKIVMSTRPALSSQKSKKEWLEYLTLVMEDGARTCGVFGRVDSSNTDDSDRILDARWFYCPENDEDQDRAALIKSMNPRAEKRSETKKYKQYYWRPLDKISRWDSEDAI